MKKKTTEAITPSNDLLTTDIRDREDSIVVEVVARTGGNFTPEKLLWRSDYYGTGKLGAFHYVGTYKGEPAVLKVQGAKPQVSEAWMIKQFGEQNKSKVMRPPELYEVLPWDDEKGYEALILEYVDGEKVVASKKVLTEAEIAAFFEVYHEYKQHAITQPWLPKPDVVFSESLAKLQAVATQVKPESPWRKKEDKELVNRAGKVLEKVLNRIDLEFQHGHFSAEDLIRKGDQVVMFSNLFWKWRYPFFDAVFGYHWVMYSLASVEGMTPKTVESQRQLWLKAIENLPEVRERKNGLVLVKAALLERAIAGLMIDSLAYIDENNPVAEHMVAATRNEVERLISELE